jgi:hypothetical protein
MGDATSTVPFQSARAKLWIGSLDDSQLEVQAQYNPKELQIDKQVTWQDHKSRDNRQGHDQAGRQRQDDSAQSDLEFNGTPPRSMSIELLFDGYEKNESVEPDIRKLERMSSADDPEAPSDENQKRRPHHCVVAWGDTQVGMRPFRCVIESLAVKYQMWNHAGVPVRATCTVKLKEANKMSGSSGQAQFGERSRERGFYEVLPEYR